MIDISMKQADFALGVSEELAVKRIRDE